MARVKNLQFVRLLLQLQVLTLMVMSLSCWSTSGETMQQVPCYFIFGASYYDNGNNNHLLTLARANYPPYGIDFPQGATGRFNNGRTTADFLAEFLGFKNYIPSFASSIKGHDILKGVNYASGSSGIRMESGQHVGVRISMDWQLLNHQTSVSRIVGMFKDRNSAAKHLGKCLYTVAMGDNDYISNYFVPRFYNTSQQYTLQEYATVLIQQYTHQLMTLYKLGARKVALFAIPPLGCSPASVAASGAKDGSACADNKINNAIKLFNAKLNPLVDQLNNKLADAKFTVVNTYGISLATSSGFKVTKAPCCKIAAEIGVSICIPRLSPCKNRSEYVWWDGVHQTEAANKKIAERSYNAQFSTDTYPLDIHSLVQLDI